MTFPDLCFLRERSGGTLENTFEYETPTGFFIPWAGGHAVVFANGKGAGAGGTSCRSTTGDNTCLESARASPAAASAPEHPGRVEIESGRKRRSSPANARLARFKRRRLRKARWWRLAW